MSPFALTITISESPFALTIINKYPFAQQSKRDPLVETKGRLTLELRCELRVWGWQLFYSLWSVQFDEIGGLHAEKCSKLNEKWLSASVSSFLLFIFIYTYSQESKNPQPPTTSYSFFLFPVNFFKNEWQNSIINAKIHLECKSASFTDRLPDNPITCPKIMPPLKPEPASASPRVGQP